MMVKEVYMKGAKTFAHFFMSYLKHSASSILKMRFKELSKHFDTFYFRSQIMYTMVVNVV